MAYAQVPGDKFLRSLELCGAGVLPFLREKRATSKSGDRQLMTKPTGFSSGRLGELGERELDANAETRWGGV